MPLTMTTNDYLVVASLLGAAAFILLLAREGRLRAPRRIPDFKFPPPPPPKRGVMPNKQWRRLKVSELKEGEIYRDRLSQHKVYVSKLRVHNKPDLTDSAECIVYNPVTGLRIVAQYVDNTLETDNPMLDPKEAEQILRPELPDRMVSKVPPADRTRGNGWT